MIEYKTEEEALGIEHEGEPDYELEVRLYGLREKYAHEQIDLADFEKAVQHALEASADRY